MIAKTAFPGIEEYARYDLEELAEEVDKKWSLDPQLIDIDITCEPIDLDDRMISIYHIKGTYQIEDLQVELKYECIDDPEEDELKFPQLYPQDLHDAYMHRYYMSMNQPYDAEAFNDGEIKAATDIMAADEDDPFADMGFDEPQEGLAPQEDDEAIEDSIDDMADTLDDLNDALDDIEEEDVDIETENNITDHYIAECEKCQGVFITSIIESDQDIEKVTGTCPLCDEECDQYIKWVIKDK